MKVTQNISSQKKLVLKELQEHGSITNVYAITELYVLRLATVINRLRSEGHKIETKENHFTLIMTYNGKA